MGASQLLLRETCVEIGMMAREEKKVGLPKRYRKPNALKHGGFSRMELFPWENSAEFQRLHRDLVEQYHPRGPLQEDCIETITSLMWRKRRIRDKRLFDVQAALERAENRVLWGILPRSWKQISI